MKKYRKSKNNVLVPLKDIKPNIKNPRKGTYERREMALLKHSLVSMGQITPIIIDEEGVILGGHRRFQAMKELGWEEARCDIRAGLTPFEKSAVMFSDNTVRQSFNAWDSRKAVADVYWNEFCHEHKFKNENDRGLTAFANKLGISVAMVHKIIKSMDVENQRLVNKLRKAKLGTSVVDEVLNAPKKERSSLANKVIKWKANGWSDVRIRDDLTATRKHLKVKKQVEKLHPAFFKTTYGRIESLGYILTKELFKKMDLEQRRTMKMLIKQNILPMWKLLEKTR